MSNPGSTLKKKSAAIAYHFVREEDEWRTDYISTHDNMADLFTKALPSGEKRWKFVSKLLAYLAPWHRNSSTKHHKVLPHAVVPPVHELVFFFLSLEGTPRGRAGQL